MITVFQKIKILSPENPDQRGSQVALEFEHGYPVIQALREKNVIGDFRDPGLIRFGFAPLYLRYVDIWDAINALADVLENETWREQRFQPKDAVT